MNHYNDCGDCDGDDEISRQSCSIELLFVLWAYRPVHVYPQLAELLDRELTMLAHRG